MSRYSSDETGVPHTCPLIDSVIAILDDVDLDEAQMAKMDMESIRSHNSDLREFGNKEYQRAENLQREVDDLQLRAEELNRENEILQQKVETVTDELEDLKKHVAELEGGR